jgi:hypothetical protein
MASPTKKSIQYGLDYQEKRCSLWLIRIWGTEPIRDTKIVVYEEVSQREKRNVPMTSLTRRELSIGGSAIVAAGSFLNGCEADNITLKNCPAYIREGITRERNQR